MLGPLNANQYQLPSPDLFDRANSGQKVDQSVGNMSQTEADISQELAGDNDDPFNLTASSKRLQPLGPPNYGRNRNAEKTREPRKYAATNHLGQSADVLAQRFAELKDEQNRDEKARDARQAPTHVHAAREPTPDPSPRSRPGESGCRPRLHAPRTTT